jgi:UDP-glucose 4-epimerase
MKVGVIGGSGFIGSHVVDKLLDAGHDVTVFDIMRPHREDVRHIFLDLFDFHKVVVALAGDYEAIYLLAAMANVNDIQKNPVETANIILPPYLLMASRTLTTPWKLTIAVSTGFF